MLQYQHILYTNVYLTSDHVYDDWENMIHHFVTIADIWFTSGPNLAEYSVQQCVMLKLNNMNPQLDWIMLTKVLMQWKFPTMANYKK